MPQETIALTVTQAMNAARRSLEAVRVTVVGEVSEFNDKAGYKAAYFTVSDEGAAMPCLMWRDRYLACGVPLRAGMLVEMDGNFSAYVPKGRMQFTVNALRLAGEGDLRLRVAALARKLEAEGLMSPARKRSIPAFPERIAVVTSPRGKAVHDVMRTLRRRYPLAELLIAGVTVEGEGASAAIVRGLEVAAAAHPDVILLVRGGGSYEDLMPFNSEEVARAVADSLVPVVTGIGHEPDTSIADMVADLRASTPTAAAEAAAPSVAELAGRLSSLQRRLGRALSSRLASAEHRVARISDRAIFTDPMALTGPLSQTLDLAEMRLMRAIPNRLSRDEARIGYAGDRLRRLAPQLTRQTENRMRLLASRLNDLSPLAILARGYSVAYAEDGSTVVSSINQVDTGDQMQIRVSDGTIECFVSGSTPAQQQNTGGQDG